jgi:hypothetical protein
VVYQDTSHANARKPVPAAAAAATSTGAVSLVVLEAKNATNVVKLVTSLATVPGEEATSEVAREVPTEVAKVLEVVSKLATLAVGMVTWPATARKARNATTVCFACSYPLTA